MLIIMVSVLALFVYLGMVNLFRTYFIVVTNKHIFVRLGLLESADIIADL